MDKVNPPVVAWKARWILCPERGAIENQCIVTQGRFFAKDAIRPLGSAVDETIDLGDAIILPMPVNAHLHLDLSAFDEPIPRRGALHRLAWPGRIASPAIERRPDLGHQARDRTVSRGWHPAGG